jgi:hypothetical protein
MLVERIIINISPESYGEETLVGINRMSANEDIEFLTNRN